MEQDKFSLFDFWKKHAGKMEVYGEATLDKEGNVIPFIEQAALVLKYLDSSTSYAAGVKNEIDALRKSNVVMMLSLLSGEVDVCEYDPHNFGIGYDELRYFSIDTEGKPIFESNNVHDWERGEDAYKIYAWEELTDYEKPAIEDILKQIVKQKLAA